MSSSLEKVPNIFKFIEVLKKVQQMNDVIVAQRNAGEAPPSKRKQCQEAQSRLKNVVDKLDDRTILDYLRGCANNVAL